jgi:hypothetical protein
MEILNSTSFWDRQTWFTKNNYIIIGSGIVGINTALELRQKFPKAKVTILERGPWPQGASTKNAGFACLGSASELLKDFETHSSEEIFNLVEQRVLGLDRLRKIVGDQQLEYKQFGGYEAFLEKDISLLKKSLDHLNDINKLLYPLHSAPLFSVTKNTFGFSGVHSKLILNAFEGQLNTGKMMEALLKKAQEANISILNNCYVEGYEDHSTNVVVHTNLGNFKTETLLIATNGFSKQLNIPNVKPGRAQVLITKPIKNLKVKGTFHIDQGYFYFRNLGDRLLFGGGRNLALKEEETTIFGETELIQNTLDTYLKTNILPQNSFEVDMRWSGILGVGNQKKPIIKKVSKNVYCGVRLGGMGVAIGSLIGKDLANIATQ